METCDNAWDARREKAMRLLCAGRKAMQPPCPGTTPGNGRRTVTGHSVGLCNTTNRSRYHRDSNGELGRYFRKALGPSSSTMPLFHVLGSTVDCTGQHSPPHWGSLAFGPGPAAVGPELCL